MEGCDERDLPGGVVASDGLGDDVDEREVDDREPEECPERLPHPVAVKARVLEGIDPDDEQGKIGREEIAHVGVGAVVGWVVVIVRVLGGGHDPI